MNERLRQWLTHNEACLFLRNIHPRLSVLVLLVGLYIPYRLVGNFILNQFYAQGAQLDTYLYSTAMWHANIMLDVPGIYLSGSFFKMHLSWFMWLPNMLSHVLPFARVEWLGMVLGVMHAALALSVMAALHLLWPSRALGAVLVKVAAGVLFALNPCAQQVVSQGHIELVGPVFALFFFLALVLKRHGWAVPALILAWSVREDMGFHLFGMIFLTLLLDWLRGVPRAEWRPWLGYALASFAYSVLAMLIIHYGVGDYGNMRNVYLGSPPFEHLSWEKFSERVSFFFIQRSWVWVPFAITCAWALASRNYYIAVGYMAFVPLILLSLAAKSDAAGKLTMHYTFPFLLAGVWPLIAISPPFRQSRALAAQGRRGMLAFLLAALLAQQVIVDPKGVRLSYGFMKFVPLMFPTYAGLMAKPALESLENMLGAARDELGVVRVDNAVKGIAPYALNSTKILLRLGEIASKNKENPEAYKPPGNINSIMYFEGNLRGIFFQKIVEANQLTHTYYLPGTRVVLITNFSLDESSVLRRMFIPAEITIGGPPPKLSAVPEIEPQQGGDDHAVANPGNND